MSQLQFRHLRKMLNRLSVPETNTRLKQGFKLTDPKFKRGRRFGNLF